MTDGACFANDGHRKRTYATKREAKHAIKQQRSLGRTMHTYRCPDCQRWHLSKWRWAVWEAAHD